MTIKRKRNLIFLRNYTWYTSQTKIITTNTCNGDHLKDLKRLARILFFKSSIRKRMGIRAVWLILVFYFHPEEYKIPRLDPHWGLETLSNNRGGGSPRRLSKSLDQNKLSSDYKRTQFRLGKPCSDDCKILKLFPLSLFTNDVILVVPYIKSY